MIQISSFFLFSIFHKMDYPIQKYNIVFVGDCRVGKTCLLHRIVSNTFDRSYLPTVAIDFLSKTI